MLIKFTILAYVMPEKIYDAGLVRLYWLSQKDSDIVKPSLRTRLADRAAAKLYHDGKVGNLVLAAGYMWGPKYPSFAETAKKDLMKYDVPENAIVCDPSATSTDAETKILLKHAHERGWKTLADINFKTHMMTINHVNRGHNIDPVHVEDILQFDDRRVADIVDRLSRSRYELGFQLYEWIALAGLKLAGGDYGQLTKSAASRRNNKRHNQIPIIPLGTLGLPMDKYDL